MIHNLKIIEIRIKKKELNLLTTNLVKLQFFKKLRELCLDNVMMDFDCTSLNPSPTYNGKSV